jgi:hypothetical protein
MGLHGVLLCDQHTGFELLHHNWLKRVLRDGLMCLACQLVSGY